MRRLGCCIYVATNVKSFNFAVRSWAKNKPPEFAFKAQKRIALEALRSLVAFTPVDTGTALGNWVVTLGSPSTANPFKGGKRIRDGGDFEANRTAAATFALRQEKKILGFKRFGPIIWITNNTPYILKLEGDEGIEPTSNQAPFGMMKITILRLNLIFGF